MQVQRVVGTSLNKTEILIDEKKLSNFKRLITRYYHILIPLYAATTGPARVNAS
jgi:hypothetical protein